MALQTGENEQGLRKIIDLTRLISIMILLLHFYYTCYVAFKSWHLTTALTDKFLHNIAHTGLFTTFHISKLIALGLLAISLAGVRGRKTEELNQKTAVAYIVTGLVLYFGSISFLYLPAVDTTIAIMYVIVTATGFLLFIHGAAMLTRIIKLKFSSDIFNKLNETFPQEERLITNDYSINLPAQYQFKR